MLALNILFIAYHSINFHEKVKEAIITIIIYCHKTKKFSFKSLDLTTQLEKSVAA